jgi:uncharacterized protein (TIGR03437 family)
MCRISIFPLLIPLCVCAQTPPRFTFQDLGSLPGMTDCVATAISQAGLVTGACGNSSTRSVSGFVSSGGVMQGFVYTAQSYYVLPLAVNDSGVAAGILWSGTSGSGILRLTPISAFFYQNGVVQEAPDAITNLFPCGITNAGLVTGFLGNGTSNIGFTDAMTYQMPTGQTTTLSTPPGQLVAAAFRVSADGTWIAGGGGTLEANGTMAVVAALWHNGKPQLLPLLHGFEYVDAFDVNDAGMAAGEAFTLNLDEDAITPAGSGHAVEFNSAANSAIDLGVLSNDQSSQATGINDSGWVIGSSSDLAPLSMLQLQMYLLPLVDPALLQDFRAFLYANGTMYDLATLVENSAGGQLPFATAINNAGQIAGTATIAGHRHAFLLTPVAPPQVNALTGAGGSIPYVANASPNGIVTVWGSNFAPAGTIRSLAAADIVDGALPTNLANTCVESGSSRWPLLFVSPGQINAVATSLPASGTVPVSVVANCGTANEIVSATLNVPVAAVAPEFLSFVQNANGQDPVAAYHGVAPYTFVGPVGLLAGATFAPAHAGDILVAFGIGWGATTPPTAIGIEAPAAATLTGSYSLTLGGIPVPVADVEYVGVSPSYAGLYQINFTVPPGVPPGNQSLVLTVNGVASPSQAYLAIAQ